MARQRRVALAPGHLVGVLVLARSPTGGDGERSGSFYDHVVARNDDDRLEDLSFQDEVWLWLEVWSADTPELREEARRAADPATDPWGYLAEFGQRVLESD